MIDSPPPKDWNDSKAVDAWLRTQPRNTKLAVAARSALRLVSLVDDSNLYFGEIDEGCFSPLLAVFRIAEFLSLHVYNQSHSEIGFHIWKHLFGGTDFDIDALLEQAVEAESPAHGAYGGILLALASLDRLEKVEAVTSQQEELSFKSDPEIVAIQLEMKKAYLNDVQQIYLNKNRSIVMNLPLWKNGTPEPVREKIDKRNIGLLASNEGWEVWTTWYEARLRGDPVDVELETRRVIEPTRWDEGPAAVNAEIAAIIADHEARKAAPTPPAPPAGDAAAQIEALLDTPALRAAYADFEVNAGTATVRMVPMPGDIPVLADSDLALDWRSRLEGLAIQPLDMIEHIRDARCNVPQALLKDLARYAHEAERGPDAVRPGVLDAYGRSLIAAGEIEDIVHALGPYLGGTLARIGDDHRRLMRDYHAQVTSRLHAAPVSLPQDATPAAVADAVEAVCASLKEQAWGGLRATRDVTDLLDAQSEAFRAAAARLDIAGDAAQRQTIVDSITAAEVSTLATIGRLALRVRHHVGSASPTARRVGYAASVEGLIDFLFFGRAAQALQAIMRWLGLG